MAELGKNLSNQIHNEEIIWYIVIFIMYVLIYIYQTWKKAENVREQFSKSQKCPQNLLQF